MTVRTIAMDYLSRREHSRHELKKKLLARDFALNDINAALDQLASENWQSDARFSENYVHYRAASGFGPLRIIMELRARGVADDMIDQHVNANDAIWKERVIVVQKKKFLGSTKSVEQQCRFLLHRGFSPESVYSCCRAID